MRRSLPCAMLAISNGTLLEYMDYYCKRHIYKRSCTDCGKTYLGAQTLCQALSPHRQRLREATGELAAAAAAVSLSLPRRGSTSPRGNFSVGKSRERNTEKIPPKQSSLGQYQCISRAVVRFTSCCDRRAELPAVATLTLLAWQNTNSFSAADPSALQASLPSSQHDCRYLLKLKLKMP